MHPQPKPSPHSLFSGPHPAHLFIPTRESALPYNKTEKYQQPFYKLRTNPTPPPPTKLKVIAIPFWRWLLPLLPSFPETLYPWDSTAHPRCSAPCPHWPHPCSTQTPALSCLAKLTYLTASDGSIIVTEGGGNLSRAPKRVENRCSNTNLNMNVHSSIFHNGQNVKASQMPCQLMNGKQNVLYLYSVILVSQKKELTQARAQMNVETLSSQIKTNIIQFHLKEISRIGKCIKTRIRLVVPRGQGEGRIRSDCLMGTGFLWEMMKKF